MSNIQKIILDEICSPDFDDKDIQHITLCLEDDHPRNQDYPCCWVALCGADLLNVGWKDYNPLTDIPCPICFSLEDDDEDAG